MSVINQMLQDLDKRRAVNEGMPGAVRPMPEAQRDRLSASPWLWGGVPLLIIAIGVAYLAWPQGSLRSNAGPVEAQAATPPAFAQTTTVQTPPAAVQQRVPILAEPKPRTPVSAPKAADVRQKIELEPTPPIMASTEAPVRTAQPPPPGEAAAILAREDAPAKPMGPPAQVSVLETKPTVLPPSSGEVRIEKQMRVSTSHDRAEADYRRGLNLINSRQGSEAIAAFTAALREDVTYGAAREALAGLLVEQHRLNEAQIALQEGLALESKQPALAMMLARLQVERGDLESAMTTLQTTLPAAADKAEYRALYAAVLQRAGHPEQATEHYAAALKLSPGNGVWWMGLAISLEAEGRTAEARQAFQSAKASGNLAPEVAAYVEQRLRELP